MKNVQYIGTADRATAHNVTFNGHGDVQAMDDELADRLSQTDAKRFRLPGGPVAGDGAQDGAQATTVGQEGDQGDATPKARTGRKGKAKARDEDA